jgi:hypothetical protein
MSIKIRKIVNLTKINQTESKNFSTIFNTYSQKEERKKKQKMKQEKPSL